MAAFPVPYGAASAPALSAHSSDLALELIPDMARMPLSYIVHAATDDDNAPLIRRGEIVVVDTGSAAVTGGWCPTEGGLFLIEDRLPPIGSARYFRRPRAIVQTFTDHRGRWCAGGIRRGIHGRTFIACDGPYPDADALAEKLIGKVVGLYQPAPVGSAH